MALVNPLPYPNMDFVPLDILTATELDQLVANIEAINATTAIDTAINNALYYKNGDTITLDQDKTPPLAGILTGGNGSIWLSVPVKKRLDNITAVTCTSFSAGIRCNGVYLGGTSPYDFLTNATSTTVKIDTQVNMIYLNFSKTGGWGGTNNTAISAGNITATFTLS